MSENKTFNPLINFGDVSDVVECILGDGEEETGGAIRAWFQSGSFSSLQPLVDKVMSSKKNSLDLSPDKMRLVIIEILDSLRKYSHDIVSYQQKDITKLQMTFKELSKKLSFYDFCNKEIDRELERLNDKNKTLFDQIENIKDVICKAIHEQIIISIQFEKIQHNLIAAKKRKEELSKKRDEIVLSHERCKTLLIEAEKKLANYERGFFQMTE
jgi:chromosome segregation ATPase